MDLWLGKGVEGQPQKKQRREESAVGEKGDERRNGAVSQEPNRAAVKDGAAVEEARRKQRRRVIDDDDESDEEDVPMVIKRRRTETETESRDGLGKSEAAGLQERSGIDVNGGATDGRSGGIGPRSEQNKGTAGGGDGKCVRAQKDVSSVGRAPEAAVAGREPTDRPIKTALKEITNQGGRAGSVAKPGANKEAPRGTSTAEDLLETQRVDPPTQMGDSEDPLDDEIFADALPENPLRFPQTGGRECGPSGESLGGINRTARGPAGVGVGAEPVVKVAEGREAGPVKERPFDSNEHSSAGPATGAGRKSIASGKETTSGNTGSFRGSQVRQKPRDT